MADTRFVIICAPYSLALENKEGFDENAELIINPKMVRHLGDNAYLVERKWYQEYLQGKHLERETNHGVFIEASFRTKYNFPIVMPPSHMAATLKRLKCYNLLGKLASLKRG